VDQLPFSGSTPGDMVYCMCGASDDSPIAVFNTMIEQRPGQDEGGREEGRKDVGRRCWGDTHSAHTHSLTLKAPTHLKGVCVGSRAWLP